VSHSRLAAVAGYIANQEEHHRKSSFVDEYAKLMKAHELEGSEEDFE
jgi:hypothetical protein